MGEYVININWRRGGGGGRSSGSGKKLKTYLNGDGQEVSQWLKIQQGAVLDIYHPFFWSKTTIGTKTGFVLRKDYPSLKDVPETAWQWDKGEEKLIINTVHKGTIVYSAAQVLRLANLGFSTHYQYASAIASSTAELNAVNEYQNAMTGLGIVGSIAAGAAVGAKIGSVAGPFGTAIGAGIGVAVATINKAVSTWNENRILNYKQAINATTSAYQLGVLGDATYGRSRQSIG